MGGLVLVGSSRPSWHVTTTLVLLFPLPTRELPVDGSVPCSH